MIVYFPMTIGVFQNIKFLGQGSKAALVLGLLFLCVPFVVMAQNADGQSAPERIFELKPRAADATTLISGNTNVKLWGVQTVEGVSPAFRLKVRTALENAISGGTLQCELKKRTSTEIFAQCVNSNDLDLGLFMTQQGYVSVDRSVVYGTIFEGAYIQAETEAQNRGLGIWAKESEGGQSAASMSGNLMLSFGFVLFLCIIAAFTVLSIIIMRGFQKVIDAQNQSVEMMGKERKLRDQERKIVAIMLDSEIKANKAKIEAFIVVYDEMLKSLKDPDKAQSYQKAGDIVQKQPALDRNVFDSNTDKLDVLGEKLSSQVIHYYARIKSKPEYKEIDPEMSIQEAVALVEGVLENAKRLDKLSGILTDAFETAGIVEP